MSVLRVTLPPSTATPIAFMNVDIASQASYIAAPSDGSFAAHIQFAEHFTCTVETCTSLWWSHVLRRTGTYCCTSSSGPTAAKTRFVTASATVRRAIADGESMPLIGCSPTAVAPPVMPPCVCEGVGARHQ